MTQELKEAGIKVEAGGTVGTAAEHLLSVAPSSGANLRELFLESGRIERALVADVTPVKPPARPVASSGEISQLVEDLGHTEFKKRHEATARLVEIGEPALESLRTATKSEDSEVRRRAEVAIERIVESSLRQLGGKLVDEMFRPSRESLDGIARFSNLEKVSKDLRSEDPQVAEAAVRSLRETFDKLTEGVKARCAEKGLKASERGEYDRVALNGASVLIDFDKRSIEVDGNELSFSGNPAEGSSMLEIRAAGPKSPVVLLEGPGWKARDNREIQIYDLRQVKD